MMIMRRSMMMTIGRCLLGCGQATALVSSVSSRSLKSTALQAMPPNDNDLPIDRIERHFDEVMQSDTVPLMKSFGTYVKSLPVRMHGPTSSYERLCKFPFWTTDQDMADMVKRLEVMRCFGVKYASAPPATGKTSSVLVAFLESAERKDEDSFSHYLYIACCRNDERNFRFDVSFLSSSRYRAYNQGEAFAFECIKLLLEGHDKGHVSKVDENYVPLFRETVDEMTAYVRELIPEGKILLHVDDHREMCNDPSKPRQSAAFREGAMTAFARLFGTQVIGTYVEPLVEISRWRSACTIYRVPVAVPRVDVDQVMNAIPELNFKRRFDPSNFKGESARLWATLYFLLGMKLTSRLPDNNLDMMMDLHLIRKSGVEFARQFDEIVDNAQDATGALRSCIEICTFEKFSFDVTDSKPTKLLVGLPEDRFEIEFKEAKHLVVVKDRRRSIFASLDELLFMRDSNDDVYRSGRDRFQQKLTMPGACDVISATPLEAAYAWALSCSSASHGYVDICPDFFPFHIECTKLAPGRFFGVEDYDLSSLEEDVIYYVSKAKGEKKCHDLFDVFFACGTSNYRNIVFIKVYGGQSPVVSKTKAKRLAKWIRRQNWRARTSEARCRFFGFVLAPFVREDNATSRGVRVIKGSEALSRLKGLAQVSPWLGPYED